MNDNKSTPDPKNEALEREIRELKNQLKAVRSEAELERAKFETLVDLMNEALIYAEPNGRVPVTNHVVRDSIGLSAQQLVLGYGTDFTASDATNEALQQEELPLAQALQGKDSRSRQLTFHLKHRTITISANASPIRGQDGQVQGGLVVFHDISRRTWAEKRTRLLNELAGMLSSGTLEQSEFEQIARMVGEVMGAWSVLALVNQGAENLQLVATYHPDKEHAAELEAARGNVHVQVGLDPGMGLVAVTGRPLLRSFPPDFERLANLDPAVPSIFRKMGCESVLILPLSARGNTLGVLMLVSLPSSPRFKEEDLEYCWQLVDRIGATLDNVQLLHDVSRKERRTRLLAELTRKFTASIELQKVLRTVAAQTAEFLGDWCTLGLQEEASDLIRPAAVYHRDPARHAALQRMAENAPLVHESIPGKVVTSRAPVLLETVTEESLKKLTGGNGPSTESAFWIKPSSYVCVPLVVRGKTLGYLELACGEESGRQLGEDELELIRELADRAAVAIQNAQLYAELQAVIRAKDDWLSVASHELKTPLTPLQVMLQLMERRVKRDKPVTLDQLSRCLAQTDRIIGLINDMLDVSKIEVGQLELSPETVQLRPLAENVVAGFKDYSEHHMIELAQGGQGLLVHVDHQRIEQVLINLVHNAIKYSPEGGLVTVTVSKGEYAGIPHAFVSVKDRGIGIPRAEQPHLFQRYFRGSNVPERNFGGLGLGLWLSHEIVLRHNGYLWAESQMNEGSTFVVALPLASQAPPEPMRSDPIIMLVDDDEAILDTAADCLRDEGYRVECAANGQQAKTVLESVRPDVVLMDLMMPLMDGWELIAHMKKIKDGEKIKVILVSAAHDVAAKAHEVNAFDYMRKPFSLDDMLQKLEKALGLNGG